MTLTVKKKRSILIGCALLLLGAGFVHWCCYSPWECRGDGTIRDSGFWTYPRYHIEFADISLNSPGQWTWKMKGVSPVPLTLHLQMVNNGQQQTLSKLTTLVECELAEDQGK